MQSNRNIAEQESTSAPTIDPTDEPTDYDAIDHQIDPASASPVSCKNLVLADGTETTIDSEAACERACTLHLWSLHSYHYWPSWGHDHFQYTSFEPVYNKDGSIDDHLIDAVGECSCDYDDRPLTLCHTGSKYVTVSGQSPIRTGVTTTTTRKMILQVFTPS